jgi:hypothetical protein
MAPEQAPRGHRAVAYATSFDAGAPTSNVLPLTEIEAQEHTHQRLIQFRW